MTRRTNYKIVEGDKDNPKRIFVLIGWHNKRYGRASLPASLIGKVVEIIVPDIPLPVDVLQGGEKPIPVRNRAKLVVEVQPVVQPAEEKKEGQETKEEAPVEKDIEEVIA